MRTNLLLNSPLVRLALSLAAAACLLAALFWMPPVKSAVGQQAQPPANSANAEAVTDDAIAPTDDKSINVFALAVAGGIFMIPIAAMSLLAAIVAIERAFARRRARVVPGGLVSGLGEMTG